MQNQHNTIDKPLHQIWNEVVEITTAIGSEARSLNVLLYLIITAGQGCTLWSRLKGRAKFIRRMPFRRRELATSLHKGSPLFAFLWDTPANTNNLLPVFQAAHRRGWYPSVLTGERVNLSNHGLNADVDQISVPGLMSLTTVNERLSSYAIARKCLSEVCARCAQEFKECKEVILQHRASLTDELALAIMATHGLRQIYDLFEPRFVITTSNLWPFDQALFVEANRVGIPSYVVQHGVTNHYWWPFDATKMFLWGKAFEQELIKFGAPAKRLATGGMPAADHLFKRFPCEKEHRQERVSSFVMLSHTHARRFDPEPYAKLKAFFHAIVKATPEIRWTVKLHPIEDEGFYQDMIESRLPNFRILPKSMSLEDAIRQADVACTLWSTAGLEALMMRRPLVVFDLHPKVYEHAWWPTCGGGVYASTVEAMINLVRQVSRDEQFVPALLRRQAQFLAETFANRGRAAEAILDNIEDRLTVINS